MTIRQRSGRAGALLALSVLLPSCGVASIDASEPDTTRLTAWSESTATDRAQRDEWHDPRLRTRLIDTDEERVDAIATLPASIPTADVERVRAVALGESVVVLAVYNRCDEMSSVVLDDHVLRLVVEKGRAQCAWAPVQVEVWSVPRKDLPDPVVFHDQRGEPA